MRWLEGLGALKEGPGVSGLTACPTPTEPRAGVANGSRMSASRRGRVYRDLAARRFSEGEREILLGLAQAEERPAAHWQALLGDEAGPAARGDVRLRLLALLARHFGSVFVLALTQR